MYFAARCPIPGGDSSPDKPAVVVTAPAATPGAEPAPPPPKKQAKAPPVAPVASDTNWMLTLDGVTNFSATAVAGRIHGMNFITERAYFQNGILTFCARGRVTGRWSSGCTTQFWRGAGGGVTGPDHQCIDGCGDAARVMLRWKTDSDSGKDNFSDTGYAMRLEFDKLGEKPAAGEDLISVRRMRKRAIWSGPSTRMRASRNPRRRKTELRGCQRRIFARNFRGERRNRQYRQRTHAGPGLKYASTMAVPPALGHGAYRDAAGGDRRDAGEEIQQAVRARRWLPGGSGDHDRRTGADLQMTSPVS